MSCLYQISIGNGIRDVGRCHFLYIMQVFDVSAGALLTYKLNLHSRHITAIVYFSPLRYLLTAAKDGTSKL